MLQFSPILLIIILLSSQIILITLFVEHLNLMKKLNETQILLYENLSKVQLDLVKIKSKQVLRDFQDEKINIQTSSHHEPANIKSSFVSKDELNKLMKDKELAFKKEINVNPGQVSAGMDIDI